MKRIFVLIILVAFCSGCASTAKRTGYLKNYEKMLKGKYLENYWADTSLISKNRYSKIRIETIKISHIADKRGVAAQECRIWLRNAMVEHASVYGKHFILTSDLDKEDAKLEVAITEMSPGSAGGRMFAGELGMGHAWVQVEGRVVDIKLGEEIVIFSDRRRSSGEIGLRDIGGDSGPDLVREMLVRIGADIMLELIEAFGF